MQSVARGEQGEPGFEQVLAVAEVQSAIKRSWASESWEHIKPID
ncbi:MAG: hypothetical protein QGI34_22585 [Candidatus Latescibacteria bacterium]|nr:hypothetical protein [Candidatus Latescibacterota bacterium]